VTASAKAMNTDLPLAGIRVVDLTRVLSGPFCSMLLADLGADVIKVETPGEGDTVRHQGAIKDGLSWYFANYNRNKRSITLNLRSDEGRDILGRLIARGDVLIDNYRPGVLAAMGFDDERLRELNPKLVRGSITGFGNTGPYRDRPSFDFIAQAMSGFMSVNGTEGEPPLRSGPPVSDLIAGLYAALGIVAGLLREGRTGQGGSASVSLTGGLTSFLSYMATDYLATGRLPKRTGNDHPIGSPYGTARSRSLPRVRRCISGCCARSMPGRCARGRTSPPMRCAPRTVPRSMPRSRRAPRARPASTGSAC
jgi:CoA:oxalate CoA-transferase